MEHINNVQTIKDKVDIVDLIGSYVQLKRSGRNLFGLCPFHQEKRPSFSVNEDIQIYKCFGCGKSGDIFTFTQEIEHVDFKEALEILATRAGVILEKSHTDATLRDDKKIIIELNVLAANVYEYVLEKLTIGENGKSYILKRGITPEILKEFKIGFAPNSKNFLTKFLMDKKGYKKEDLLNAGLSVEKNNNIEDKFKNRIVFPIISTQGEIVAFSCRFIGETKGQFAPPKYLNSPQTSAFHKSRVLFGLYQAKDAITHENKVIISEGQMNIITSHKVEVKNIVASMGTALTLEHLKILSRYTSNILFCFDNDPAGQNALMRSLLLANELDLNTKVISLKLGKDPDEEINKSTKQWLQDIEDASDSFEYLLDFECLKYNSLSNEQKLKIIQNLKPYLFSLLNPIKRELSVQSLSTRFEISTDTIEKYIGNKISNKSILISEKINDVAKINGKYLEEFYFSLLAQNWDELKQNLMDIDTKYFYESKFTGILSKACFAQELAVNELIDSLDESEQQIFKESTLKYIPMDKNISLNKIFNELYKRIQIVSIKNEMKELKDQLRITDDNESLTLKLTTLINEMKELK